MQLFVFIFLFKWDKNKLKVHVSSIFYEQEKKLHSIKFNLNLYLSNLSRHVYDWTNHSHFCAYFVRNISFIKFQGTLSSPSQSSSFFSPFHFSVKCSESSFSNRGHHLSLKLEPKWWKWPYSSSTNPSSHSLSCLLHSSVRSVIWEKANTHYYSAKFGSKWASIGG